MRNKQVHSKGPTHKYQNKQNQQKQNKTTKKPKTKKITKAKQPAETKIINQQIQTPTTTSMSKHAPQQT